MPKPPSRIMTGIASGHQASRRRVRPRFAGTAMLLLSAKTHLHGEMKTKQCSKRVKPSGDLYIGDRVIGDTLEAEDLGAITHDLQITRLMAFWQRRPAGFPADPRSPGPRSSRPAGL